MTDHRPGWSGRAPPARWLPRAAGAAAPAASPRPFYPRASPRRTGQQQRWPPDSLIGALPREAEARSPERAEHRRACALPIVCLPGSSGRRARQFSALSLSVAKVGDGKEAATSGCINPTNPTPAAACLLLPRRSAAQGRGQPARGRAKARRGERTQRRTRSDKTAGFALRHVGQTNRAAEERESRLRISTIFFISYIITDVGLVYVSN